MSNTAQSRDYQERICDTAIKMYKGEYYNQKGVRLGAAKSILIDSAVGSGKTVMGLKIAERLVSEYGLRIGWTAMRRNLLKQTDEMRKEFNFDIPNMRFISMFDKNPPTDVDVLFEDEAHHSACDSAAHIHGTIKPKLTIGLSATTYRSDNSKLSYEYTIRDAGINQLISEGWLSKYDYFQLAKWTPETVVMKYMTDPDKWGKSVIFFLSLKDCWAAHAALVERGIRAEVVWGGSNREAQLADFEEGKVKVLISMSILTEGADFADLQTVWIRPASKLPTVQMGGRVLRLHPPIPIKQIVSSEHSPYPFTRVASPTHQYTDMGGDWRSIEANPMVDQLVNESIIRVSAVDVQLPNLLKGRKTFQRGTNALRDD